MAFFASRWVLGPACVLAFAALCWDSSTRLAESYPSYWHCLEDPLRYEGKPLWIAPNPVVASREGSFDVDYWGDRVRVRTPDPAPVGIMVMVYGTFRSDRTIDATSWKEEPHYRMKRRGVVVISFFVLLIGILVFHRTFAWRDGAFHVREGA